MCLAIPGKIVEVSGSSALVEYPMEKRKVNLLGMDVSVGEYVFVQGGFVVEKIPEEEALESLKVWEEML
jgi:hydrogenase assembly chaperone HypC/HupF